MGLLISLIFIPLIVGALLYAYGHYRYNYIVYFMQAIETIIFAYFLNVLLSGGNPSTPDWNALIGTFGGWPAHIGIQVKLDPLSLMFCGMTLISFWFIWLFIWQNRRTDQKFIFFLCVLETTLLALFTTNDLFTIFVLAEAMTVICAILITYKRDAFSVRSGLYYLFYNSWGMVLYLMGILWIYQALGTFNIDAVIAASTSVASNGALRFGMVFILAGVFIKSAFFPVFVWLPPAHSAAPASISALLSGVIVKSGLFILLRLDGFAFFPDASTILLVVGLASALIGAAGAMVQSDAKRILAFHTISQVGLITTGIGLGGTKAELGAMLHIFNHFVFKSLLFLSVGLIVQESGERRVKKLSGVASWHLPIAICLIIGIIGITGVPFFNGSLSKLLIKSGSTGTLVTALLMAINLGTLISFIKLGGICFGHKSDVLIKSPFKASISAPVMMAIVMLISFPAELLLLKWIDPAFMTYTIKKSSNDVLTFVLTATAAYLIFKYILKPLLNRLPATFHDDMGFGRGIIMSVVTTTVLLVLLV